MRNFLMADGTYMGLAIGNPEGEEGTDWTEIDSAPEKSYQKWDGSKWATPIDIQWDEIRAKRNDLLAKFDHTQLADAPLTDTQKAAWASYRTALRGLPQSFSFPNDVVWPTPPTG